MKNKKQILKHLTSWLDAVFMILGMMFLVIGMFLIFRPAGFLTLGLCFIALAFFVASKQVKGGDS